MEPGRVLVTPVLYIKLSGPEPVPREPMGFGELQAEGTEELLALKGLTGNDGPPVCGKEGRRWTKRLSCRSGGTPQGRGSTAGCEGRGLRRLGGRVVSLGAVLGAKGRG